MKNLIAKAGIDWNDFFGKLEMESPYAQIWKGEDMLSEHIALHCHDFYEIIFCIEGSVNRDMESFSTIGKRGMMMVTKPDISPDFTIEDIHKIREYHYELTKDMTLQERLDFYNEGAKVVLKEMEERKAQHSQKE